MHVPAGAGSLLGLLMGPSDGLHFRSPACAAAVAAGRRPSPLGSPLPSDGRGVRGEGNGRAGRGRIVRRLSASPAMEFAKSVCVILAPGGGCSFSPRVRVRGNDGLAATECRLSKGLLSRAINAKGTARWTAVENRFSFSREFCRA